MATYSLNGHFCSWRRVLSHWCVFMAFCIGLLRIYRLSHSFANAKEKQQLHRDEEAAWLADRSSRTATNGDGESATGAVSFNDLVRTHYLKATRRSRFVTDKLVARFVAAVGVVVLAAFLALFGIFQSATAAYDIEDSMCRPLRITFYFVFVSGGTYSIYIVVGCRMCERLMAMI